MTFDVWIIQVCLGLFLTVGILCALLLQTKRYLLLLLWPILIYFCGPAITSIFADAPVLSKYVFPETVIAETVMIFAYFASWVLLDMFLNISGVIEAAFNSRSVAALARSPVFLVVYSAISFVACVLQVKVLMDIGSIFTGEYVAASAENGVIPYWGFLAGLYELIFLCFVLFLLSGQRSKLRFFVIGVYVATALLRVAGGTRLILIKEVAVICILFYMRGNIKRLHLLTVVAVILTMGSAIGLLRSNDETQGFGPFYGLAMESGLDALTLNVAYQVEESGYLEQHGQIVNTVEYVVLSAIPSFLRFGISEKDLAGLAPYGAALGFGFETPAPVGGMSGFATIAYLSSYPLIGTIVLVVVMAFLFKLIPPGPLKQIVIVVLCMNAIHFWRDPVDIAFKNVVQDVFCALLFLYLPPHAARSSQPFREIKFNG